jgi:hypothetical protein
LSFENFLVTAKCFRPVDKWDTASLRESLKVINNQILVMMESRGYSSSDIDSRDVFLGKVFLTMTFISMIGAFKPPLGARIKKGLGLKSAAELTLDQHLRGLSRMIDHHAYEVRFAIGFSELSETLKGFAIDIEAEPAIVAKMKKLGITKQIDDSHYDNIVLNTKRDVSAIINALGMRVLEAPQAMRVREKVPVLPLVDSAFMERLPSEVSACLQEANLCFTANCFLASSVMIRKAIEVAVTKKLLQEGRELRLYDREGYEIGLGKKLDLLPEVAPQVSRQLDEISLVKWLGDVSAHDPRTKIISADLQTIMPLVRSFLTNLELKL